MDHSLSCFLCLKLIELENESQSHYTNYHQIEKQEVIDQLKRNLYPPKLRKFFDNSHHCILCNQTYKTSEMGNHIVSYHRVFDQDKIYTMLVESTGSEKCTFLTFSNMVTSIKEFQFDALLKKFVTQCKNEIPVQPDINSSAENKVPTEILPNIESTDETKVPAEIKPKIEPIGEDNVLTENSTGENKVTAEILPKIEPTDEDTVLTEILPTIDSTDESEVPTEILPDVDSTGENEFDNIRPILQSEVTLNDSIANNEPECSDKELNQTTSLDKFDFLNCKFTNLSDFFAKFEEFCKANFTVFTVIKSRKNRNGFFCHLNLGCVHYGNPRPSSTSSEVKNNKSTKKIGCTFEIVLKYRSSLYVVTFFNTEHKNHQVNEKSYKLECKNRKLDKSEISKYIKNYKLELNVPNTILKRIVKKETGKIILTSDINNYIARGTKNSTDNVKLTLQILEDLSLKDPNSTIKTSLLEDEDGQKKINFIYYQSSDMKEAVKKFHDVLFVDKTYSSCREGYNVYPFCIKDEHSKALTVAIIIVSDENSDTLNKAFKIFEEANGSSITLSVNYIIIDDAFHEISALSNLFPNARNILCAKHAKNTVINYIQTLQVHVQYRKTLQKLWLKMLNSKTVYEYDSAFSCLNSISKTNSEIKKFFSYFETNWHLKKEMWAKYILSSYYILASYSTNLSKINNNNIKNFVPRYSKFSKFVEGIINFIDNQYMSYDLKQVRSKNKFDLPENNKSDCDFLELISKHLTKSVSTKLFEEYKCALQVISKPSLQELITKDKESLTCTLIQGTCSYKDQTLPCRHMMATRILNSEPPIDVKSIGKKWLKVNPSSSKISPLVT